MRSSILEKPHFGSLIIANNSPWISVLFSGWPKHRRLISMDSATQVFKIVKQQNHNYLTKDNFKPVLKDLLDNQLGM
jgi:hypothetical protein